MNLRHFMLAGLLLPPLSVCPEAHAEGAVRDEFSFADPRAFLTRHLELDLEVDFDNRELRGTATLRMETVDGGEHVVLDTRDLKIQRVRVGRGPRSLADADFHLGERDPGLGQALYVEAPEGIRRCDEFLVEIAYATDPGATALQWLPPRLTAGGQYPFLFSQSQSIHARSWVPLQDTPAARITYAATIRTPPHMLALMSANNDPMAPRTGEYRFEMPQPIPSYLLAIAVGNVYFAPLGDITGVYAEPEVLGAAAREFAGTQDMLDVAERRYGPYEWGRYDLLILPPSFPYGGMENPRLSFITPSVIAGDQSLVSLIAHELAHSWSGNLVTNATWRDIWLNEGITSYLTARLMEELYGRERADEERVLQWASLKEKLDVVPERLQPLAPEIRPGDGEFAQQGMQYAKGQFFLEHLERAFGREAFDGFLAGYFDHFKWQSITTARFLDYLDQHLLEKHPGRYSREQAEAWLYRPGVPEGFEPPRSERLAEAERLARDWADGEISASDLPLNDWSPQATIRFINTLPPDLDAARLGELEERFGFSTGGNAEVSRAWFIQAAQRRYRPAYPAMREHLTHHGRMRLVTPVYAALAANGTDLALAEEIFAEARSGYHPITVMSVAKALADGAE